MKTRVGSLLCIVAFIFLQMNQSSAQDHNLTRKTRESQIHKLSSDNVNPGTSNTAIRKTPGHYDKTKWRLLIDSLWGPGLSLADKLTVFDNFWSQVDQKWGGFPNLVVNWDSLRNVYRPEVAAGVSRGRFAAILSRLTRALNENHVYTIDVGVDSTMRFYRFSNPEYPNYPSCHYEPGVPLIAGRGGAGWFRTWFGAGLTPLPDSTALVYSVMPNHPLGIQPGDIVLGYDGVPWMKLLHELLDAELPILQSGLTFGSTPAASLHTAIISAGANWGLFDTIDVLKYGTNQILHYPTSLLASIEPPYFIASEQLPVNGVPFPDIQNTELVSWGVVQGTTIGYIYVWDWWGGVPNQTMALFTQAVNELLQKYKVRGLILDFRTNYGGTPNNANGGLSQLFNFDPISNYFLAGRVPGSDHLAFTLTPYNNTRLGAFTPASGIYDHPIAVLTGPRCVSAGDYNAHRMRFHPMVRFFGLPTCGAYTAQANDHDCDTGVWMNTYHHRTDHSSVYSSYANEGYLIHKPFPVDEELWLTRDAVAKGEDDVVNRALAWINTLSYVHDVSVLHPYIRPEVDSVTVTAVLTNPGSHAMGASVLIKNVNGVAQDSAALLNDAPHGDGLPGDSILGARCRAPLTEGFYTIDLRTHDQTIASSRFLPAVSLITTTGPVVCIGDTSSVLPQWGLTVGFRLKVSNKGTIASTPAIAGTIRPLDTAATLTSSNPSFTVGDLIPGQERLSGTIRIAFSAWCSGTRDIRFELLFSSKATQYWRDTLTIRVVDPTDIVQEEREIPKTYELEQNYPNPFNPSTTIRYGLPARSHVTLTVFNTLGQQVSVPQNGEQHAGYHELRFDGANLPSGVYFYRMQAGSHTETKRLLILK